MAPKQTSIYDMMKASLRMAQRVRRLRRNYNTISEKKRCEVCVRKSARVLYKNV